MWHTVALREAGVFIHGRLQDVTPCITLPHSRGTHVSLMLPLQTKMYDGKGKPSSLGLFLRRKRNPPVAKQPAIPSSHVTRGCWQGESLLVHGNIKSSETIERKWTADSEGKSPLNLLAADSSPNLCHTKCGSMPPLWAAQPGLGWTPTCNSYLQLEPLMDTCTFKSTLDAFRQMCLKFQYFLKSDLE